MSDWYLLFDGSSPDGRGYPKFVGRTTNKAEAKKHHEKVSRDPYSTGMVMIANDNSYTRADDDWFK